MTSEELQSQISQVAGLVRRARRRIWRATAMIAANGLLCGANAVVLMRWRVVHHPWQNGIALLCGLAGIGMGLHLRRIWQEQAGSARELQEILELERITQL